MSVTIYVEASELGEAPLELLEAAVRHTLADAGVEDAEVSLTLLPDADIRRLNHEYLGHDRPTDVIGFGLGGEPRVGDVYLGFDRARAQADEHGIGLDEELVRLAVHGTLHVLGHDHPEGDARHASPMFTLQERLVREVLAAR